jgi:hypothetical protein
VLAVRGGRCDPVACSDAKVANRNVRDFGWEIARGRFATPADFPLHDYSPYSHVHVRRESLGFVHRSKGHFLSPRANPYVAICNLFIRAPATGGGYPALPRRLAPPPPPPPARAGILPFAKHFSELWNAKKRVQQFVEAVKRAEVEWKRAGGCMLRKTKRKKIIKAGTGTAGVPQVRATCFDELRSIRVQDELTPPFRDALPISKTRV